MARKLLRLYLEALLEEGLTLSLDKEQAHYLGTVMRLKEGSCLKVFSTSSGEWEAKLTQLDRKKGELLVEKCLRLPEKAPFLGLAFCPLRSHRLSFLIEKATELGATHFYPLISDRTQQKMPSLERLKAVAIEASEQCERLSIPIFASPQKLSSFLVGLNNNEEMGSVGKVTSIVCDERRQAEPLTTERASSYLNPLLFIGPEGGFSPEEFQEFDASKDFVSIRLGSLVLRSETAALAALSRFQR